MLKLDHFDQIYLHRPFVDFRKSINGLCGIIVSEMDLDPFQNYLFIFMGKRRDRIKILYWDRTGFALWYKRLEKEKFSWPKNMEEQKIILKIEELEWLLNGLNPWKMKPHQELKYKFEK